MSKRRYKTYRWDESVSIPKTTKWRKKNELHLNLFDHEYNFIGDQSGSADTGLDVDNVSTISSILDEDESYYGDTDSEMSTNVSSQLSESFNSNNSDSFGEEISFSSEESQYDIHSTSSISEDTNVDNKVILSSMVVMSYFMTVPLSHKSNPCYS